MTSKYFPEGEISSKKMRKAILFARQELESIELIYKRAGWDAVFGSSGTIQTIRDLARKSGDDPAIYAEGLYKLKEAVIDAGHFKNLKFSNLDANRAPVLAGGLAILLAIFDALEIKSMQVSDGALREGLLLDMVGRQKNQDVREKTVEELISRYGIDREQVERVERISTICFEQLQQDMNLNPETDIKLLRWAARLHEIGLTIAHSQHHRHAGYLLKNSELAGFSREEQNYLALIVRSHRRKISLEGLESLADDTRQKICHLIVLLRLAVVLNRSRAGHAYKELKMSCKENRIKMKFPDNWLATHPLTEADLALEADYMKTLKVSLEFS
jgi:exopolyphosphatase/guanosine-5'-triphosphate,3'-diphosphate pyrophosphatase